MYSIQNYNQYEGEIIHPKQIQSRRNSNKPMEIKDINNKYGISADSQNNLIYDPLFKINSHFFKRENLIKDDNKNYSHIIPVNKYQKYNRKNRLFPSYSIESVTSFTNKNRVIVHKRNINNFNNNSTHIIKFTSKNKEKKKKLENFNKKITYINDSKIQTLYNNNNTSLTNNNINNFNFTKIEKNIQDKNNNHIFNIKNNDNKSHSNLKEKINSYNNTYLNNIKDINKNKKNNINKDLINHYTKKQAIFNSNKKVTNDFSKENDIKKHSKIEEKSLFEKLIKEKKDLEKKLSEIIDQNQKLKNINLDNEELIIKNNELIEQLVVIENKVKDLENENKNYLIEIDNNKKSKMKIVKEIRDINNKLKIASLKYLMEKKMIKEKKKMKIYFIKYKEISNQIKIIEKEDKTYKSLINIKTSELKINEENDKKEKEKSIIDVKNKRNKILKRIFNNKMRENYRFIHSCFNKFYYIGLIIELENKNKNIGLISNYKNIEENTKKLEKPQNLEEQKSSYIQKEQQDIKKLETKIEETKLIEKQKKEMPEKIEDKREEIKEKEKKDIQLSEEEIKKQKEEVKKMNKINQNRRKKLKKLLEDEKKQKLQIKRVYFKKFHFKALFFYSNPNEERNINNFFNEHIESRKTEEMKKKRKRTKRIKDENGKRRINAEKNKSIKRNYL